ncbi:MAG: endonuclease V [Halobacteriaceae archaeon]
MEVSLPDLYPDPAADRGAQLEQQRTVARTAQFRDAHAIDPDELSDAIVVGIDQAFTADAAISAAVAMRDGEVIETRTAEAPLRMPYVPGLLSYREGESIVEALRELDTPPDLLICDGSGRIHFRQAGIATHVGVLFDRPAIGVAKSLLCGRPTEATDEPMPEGTTVPVQATESVEPVATADADWPRIGTVYQSRQYANPDHRHINPLYVSPGHRVRASSATELVAACCAGYKLPEPTRLADEAAEEAKGKD